MENIQHISIDINNKKIQKNIYMKQYDVKRHIVFSITENGVEKDITGMNVVFKMDKKDGHYIFDDVPIENNKVILDTTPQMTTTSGILPYQLSFYNAEQLLISTVTGYIDCEESVINDEEIASSTEINLLAEMLDEVAKIHDIAAMHKIAEEVKNDSADAQESLSEVEEETLSAKKYADISKSYAVGGTGMYHENGLIDDEDNSKYYYEKTLAQYNKLLTAKKVILHAESWDNLSQTVRVDGITANEDEQLIVVRPRTISVKEYTRCNVMAERQGEGLLYFTCELIPRYDLYIYVMVQTTTDYPINLMGTALPTQSLGVDSNIYIQYDNDEIINLFVKKDGEWLVFGGGGSGQILFDGSSAEISEGVLTMSAEGVGANYIDTSNMIYEITPENWDTSGNDVTYVATRDCAVIYNVATNSNYNDLDVYINNDTVVVDGGSSKNPTYVKGVQFLKMGQTIGFKGYNYKWDYVKKNYLRVYSLIVND